jgi:hypothetical protein
LRQARALNLQQNPSAATPASTDSSTPTPLTPGSTTSPPPANPFRRSQSMLPGSGVTMMGSAANDDTLDSLRRAQL